MKVKNYFLILMTSFCINNSSHTLEFKNETLENISTYIWCANVSNILSLGFKTANNFISGTLNVIFDLKINPNILNNFYDSIEKVARSESIADTAIGTFDLIIQSQKLKQEREKLEKRMDLAQKRLQQLEAYKKEQDAIKKNMEYEKQSQKSTPSTSSSETFSSFSSGLSFFDDSDDSDLEESDMNLNQILFQIIQESKKETKPKKETVVKADLAIKAEKELISRLKNEFTDIGKNLEKVNTLIKEGKEVVDKFSNVDLNPTEFTQNIFVLNNLSDQLNKQLAEINKNLKKESDPAKIAKLKKDKSELVFNINKIDEAITNLQDSVVLVGHSSYLKYGAMFPKESSELSCKESVDVIQTPMLKLEGKTTPAGACFYANTFKYGGARSYKGDSALRIIGFAKDLNSRRHTIWLPGLYPIVQEGNNPPHIFNKQGICSFN